MTLTEYIRMHRRPRLARLGGISGLNWYATVTPTRGADLREGHWLDTPDHSGARRIVAASGCDRDGVGAVMFFGGDSEIVHADQEYTVVEPASLVAPDRLGRARDGGEEGT